MQLHNKKVKGDVISGLLLGYQNVPYPETERIYHCPEMYSTRGVN